MHIKHYIGNILIFLICWAIFSLWKIVTKLNKFEKNQKCLKYWYKNENIYVYSLL